MSLRDDAKTRSVLLDFNTLTADKYELRVSPTISSAAGVELVGGYLEQFTAISDFSSLVDFKFTNPRSDRQNQTISATVGQKYTYQVAANDPDGSVLGYLLYDAPQGMTFTARTANA